MQAKNQGYCQKTNFRQDLWSEVSASCDSDEWCYSYAERRLFYIIFGITAVLGVIYFSGFTNELASMFKSSRTLAKLNETRIESMQLSSSPIVATATPESQALTQ